MDEQLQKAREQGMNESKVGRFFAAQVTAQIEGKQEDAFYLRVKLIMFLLEIIMNLVQAMLHLKFMNQNMNVQIQL